MRANADILRHPALHVVGMDANVPVAAQTHKLQPGDCLCLCTGCLQSMQNGGNGNLTEDVCAFLEGARA